MKKYVFGVHKMKENDLRFFGGGTLIAVSEKTYWEEEGFMQDWHLFDADDEDAMAAYEALERLGFRESCEAVFVGKMEPEAAIEALKREPMFEFDEEFAQCVKEDFIGGDEA